MENEFKDMDYGELVADIATSFHYMETCDRHIEEIAEQLFQLKEDYKFWETRWENLVKALHEHDPDFDPAEPTVDDLRASERRAMGLF